MPPKKNKVELNKKQTAKKPEIQKKQKVVKPKPKLKTPTVIKVKIPITKPVRTVFSTECKGNSPTKNNIKIQLSNDVARYALAKPNATKTEPKQKDVTIKRTIENTMVIQKKPKRTRKKKMPVPLVEVKEEQIETNCDIASSSLVETFKNPSPIKSNKINTRAIKKIDKKGEITPKVTTEPSKNIQIKKSNLNRKRPLRSDGDATPVKKRRGPRGKKSVDDTTKADLKSPSPLDAKAIDVTENTAPPSVKTGNKSGNTDAEDCSSRRTSVLSECLSWTKEISSSSTTTLVTVCSATDFFRIDNKLPLIELKDLKYDNKINKSTSDSSDTDSSTSSSSSDSSSSVCFSPKTPEMECPPSPNLSNSTIFQLPVSYLTSPNKDIKPNYTKEQLNDFTKTLKTLEKVKTMMNNLDQEILNWIGYADEYTNIENSKKLKNSQISIANHFQKENGVVKLCQQISNNSQEKPSTVAQNQDSTISKQKVQTAVTNDQFVASSATENISSTFTDKKSDIQPTPLDVFSKPDSPKYNNDVDDDALSLFAESITAIDSSKYNTSVASIAYAKSSKEHEEYVPEPLSKTFKPLKPYQPTKIDSRNDILVNDDINYEKTDETAGNHLYTNFERQTVKPAVTQSNIQEINVHYDNSQNKGANVISTLPKNHTTKLIYHYICVYNLVGGCTRSSCRYSHIKLTEIEIKNHIVRLTNEVFIRELLYVKNKRFLRNLFGLCYVEECERRKLTRKLIEMAHKFIAKSNKHNPEEIALIVSVVEIVLLHLNSVDLHEYRDLLTQFIANKQLCEHLMQYIGQTQNFSRFKSIFIKLTDFLVGKNRKVNPVVASNILERVAILPLDEQIARAVLKVMEISTDNSVVFNNSMIMKFESQLTKLSEDLLMKFLALKANAKVHVAAASMISSLASPTVQEVRNNSLLETDMCVSPDSSVFNGSNISYRQLSRTLDLSRPKITITNDFAMSRGGNDNDNDDFGQESSGERYRCWRQSSFKTRRPTEIRNDFKRNKQQRPYVSYNPGNFHRRF